jgi:hypothetical protein
VLKYVLYLIDSWDYEIYSFYVNGNLHYDKRHDLAWGTSNMCGHSTKDGRFEMVHNINHILNSFWANFVFQLTEDNTNESGGIT